MAGSDNHTVLQQYSINYKCKKVYGEDPNVITVEHFNLNGSEWIH